ncbi:methylthioribulose 1-phosphate dehydratase [Sphingomonas sp. LB-2]|uniref:methylthioribulose 1-phosphate dehydratase n=1 Tax=Sphingomonas caeni TaxID=2984949 RepID=UPI00222FAFE3|nr:methylthioribulose 1-phosphate dehydratase [Sphingomonas caeni]MCW3848217.1 methylthioribulose 1-phosphate dehydratase [Sphingomonas caeni]
MTMSFEDAAFALVEVGRRLDARGWAPATGGNYSARLDDGSIALTTSGKHKGRLVAGDIMRVALDGTPLTPGKPSAETGLHLALYRLFPHVNAVLHGHSPEAVGMSRALSDATEYVLRGHEMLKIYPGIDTHETEARLPIVDNSQDMAVIEAAVTPQLRAPHAAPAYLIRSHGLYSWGRTVAEAEYILEATEWMIAAELAERSFRNGSAR